MTDPLARHAASQPEAVMLDGPDGTITYAEALSEIRARIGALGGTGRINLAPRRDFDSILDLLAAVRTGRPVVVTDPDDPRPLPPVAVGPEVETVVFTSGVAGGRKGVRLTSANWRAATAATVAHLALSSADRWLLVLPLHHVGGLSVTYRCIEAGASILVHPTFDPTLVAADLAERATIASLVPVMLDRVLAARPGPFPAVRWALIGGGNAGSDLLDRAEAAGMAAVPTYGMTETAAQIACGRPGDRRLFPLPGVDLRIADDGAIQVRGDMVSPGYVGEGDRAPGEYFTTGDRGELGPAGELVVRGRTDRVIVSGGENVDPAEVEAVLAAIPEIGEVAVVGLPDPIWGESVAAAFTGPVETVEIERSLEASLPRSHHPRRLLRVDQLPRNDMGKVDALKLRSLFD